jgi:hypothetical protein
MYVIYKTGKDNDDLADAIFGIAETQEQADSIVDKLNLHPNRKKGTRYTWVSTTVYQTLEFLSMLKE